MKQFLFLALVIALSSPSVSSSASPPFAEVSGIEPLIKQAPVTEFTQAEPMVITNTSFEIVAVTDEQPYCVTEIKRQPIVQSVCSTNAPVIGVDGRAVLSWQKNDYKNLRILELGFHYSEGRATEYRS